MGKGLKREEVKFTKNFEGEPKDFYVYLHKRRTDSKVFYVGKGKDRRYCSFTNRSDLWLKTASKYGVIVEIVKDRLQEWYALELECELIALYGRKDSGNGYLVNHTDGGEGITGHIFTEDRRAKMRGRVKELSARYDDNLYTLKNYKTGESVSMTKMDMHNSLGLIYASLLRTSKGVASVYKGWYIPGEINQEELDARLNGFKAEHCHRTDTTVYEFINVDSLEEFTGSRLDFIKNKGFSLDSLLSGNCLVCKRWTTVELLGDYGLTKLKDTNKGVNNGRADQTVYTFVNLVSDDVFVGTRFDFENKTGTKIGVLFHRCTYKRRRALTQRHWCLLENKELALKQQSGFYNKYTFMNTETGDIFYGSRTEFQIKYKISIKNLFVSNRISHLNWVLVK